MKLMLPLLLVAFYLMPAINSNPPQSKKKTEQPAKVEDGKYPAPPDNVSRLFYVQRDPNANTVIYDLNLDKTGRPDAENPVHIYWIKYADKGQKDELNYIQRKFAYGLSTKKVSEEQFDVRFVSYKKLALTLKKGDDNKFHIFVNADQKQIALNSIFVKVEGGSFWLPNIVYVELKGIDPTSGKEVVSRFKP